MFHFFLLSQTDESTIIIEGIVYAGYLKQVTPDKMRRILGELADTVAELSVFLHCQQQLYHTKYSYSYYCH